MPTTLSCVGVVSPAWGVHVTCIPT
jgi:hypothetical protein